MTYNCNCCLVCSSLNYLQFLGFFRYWKTICHKKLHVMVLLLTTTDLCNIRKVYLNFAAVYLLLKNTIRLKVIVHKSYFNLLPHSILMNQLFQKVCSTLKLFFYNLVNTFTRNHTKLHEFGKNSHTSVVLNLSINLFE